MSEKNTEEETKSKSKKVEGSRGRSGSVKVKTDKNEEGEENVDRARTNSAKKPKGDTEKKGDTDKKGDNEKKGDTEKKGNEKDVKKLSSDDKEDKSAVKSPRSPTNDTKPRSISISKSPTKKAPKSTDSETQPAATKKGGLLGKKGGIQKNSTLGSDARKGSKSLQSSTSTFKPQKSTRSWKEDSINIQISKEVATWLLSRYTGTTPTPTESNVDPTGTEEFNSSNWSNIISSVAKRENYSIANTSLPTRTKIVEEMVQTERTYVQSLQQVVQNFINPLRMNQILPEIECENLFSVIEIIIDLNKVFLKKLEEGFKLWPGVQNIGQIYKDNVPLFKCYYRYIRRFNTIVSRITELNEENHKFKEFCTSQEMQIKNSLTLNALLIMPVQRLPRYELLLRELIKNTPEGHSDIPSLQKAFECIREVNEYINTRSKKDEEMHFILNVLEVQRKIKGVKGVVGEDTVGFLMIKIIEGRKLPAMDKNGKSDPYCLIFYKDHPKLKTKIVFKSLTPKWEENFVIEIPKEHKLTEKILIRCLDHDQSLEDDDMGYLSFTLGDLVKGARMSGWYKLKSPLEMDEEEIKFLGKIKILETKREEKIKELEKLEGEIFIEFIYRSREEKDDE